MWFGGGGGGSRPRTTRFGGTRELRLGRGFGLAFRAWESRSAIQARGVVCPIISLRGAMPCRGYSSRIPAAGTTRVESPMVKQVDYALQQTSSPSPVKCSVADPMLVEAALCTPWLLVSTYKARMHSIDVLPRGSRPLSCDRLGIMGAALDAEFELWAGWGTSLLHGLPDGPDVMCGFGLDFLQLESANRDVALEVDLCLSGPEECGSGLRSPMQPTWSADCSPVGASTLVNTALHDVVEVMAWSVKVELDQSGADVVIHAVTMEHTGTPLPVEDFINSFKKPLMQPILLSPPRLRTTRAARAKEIEDEDLTPKCSARLVAKSKFREAKPEA